MLAWVIYTDNNGIRTSVVGDITVVCKDNGSLYINTNMLIIQYESIISIELVIGNIWKTIYHKYQLPLSTYELFGQLRCEMYAN